MVGSAPAAMNTIPTIFNERKIPYTVSGGQNPASDALPISALVLNRGGRQFNPDVYTELEKLRFDSILSVESPAETVDLDYIAKAHPKLRFLLVRDKISPGEAVNMGIQESTGDFVFVLWSDMIPSLPLLGTSFIDRLRERRALCLLPSFSGRSGEQVPSKVMPAFHRRNELKLISILPEREGEPCLFPFDYCGIYQRIPFMLSGGYDYSISSPWWQKADFGFRAHLWSERIIYDPSVKLVYCGQAQAEDSTPDASYARFYLKNIAPRFSGESSSLPYSLFPSFALRSGLGLFASWEEFRLAKAWVAKNSYLFRRDALAVTDLWEKYAP